MAQYEFTANVINNSSGEMEFLYYCKGTDENPSGAGTTKNNLYHGEMLEGHKPSDISAGGSGSFKAKSTGSTIQGTVVYKMHTGEQVGEQVGIYFHVPDIDSRHNQADNITIDITDDSNHASATYSVTEVVPLGNIEKIYRAVAAKNASSFTITNPNRKSLPDKADSGSYHQQGIQRTARGEYVVSGSAKDTGYIYFANANGEIVNVIEPDSDDEPDSDENYNHCGGIQVVDDILVVGYERLEKGEEGTSKVLFYDITNIDAPEELTHLTISRQNKNSTAGAVALSRYGDGWFLLVANWNANRLDFYTCDEEDLTSEDAGFSKQGSWSKDLDGLGPDSIDDHWEGYQNINLFTQNDGTMYFIGMHTNIVQAFADWADLYSLEYSVHENGNFNGAVTKKDKMHFYRNGSGPRFLYGSGYYYSESSNRFYVYACESQLQDNENSSRCNKWE